MEYKGSVQLIIDAIHNSQDLYYKNPFGAVECDSNIDIRIKIEAETGIE